MPVIAISFVVLLSMYTAIILLRSRLFFFRAIFFGIATAAHVIIIIGCLGNHPATILPIALFGVYPIKKVSETFTTEILPNLDNEEDELEGVGQIYKNVLFYIFRMVLFPCRKGR